ncbi:structural protein [Xanthomonas phage XaC1]|nr:structural protein [Xanthomonas phage XaC1]
MATFERINGFNKSSVLGYFMGKNAAVSVAIGSAGDVALKDTGAVASLVEVKRFLNSDDDQALVDFLNAKGVVRVDGSAFVLASVEADYIASHSAQTNLKRVVDIVQQRAVILLASDIDVSDVTEFRNAPAGVTGNVDITAAEVITFMVERANVFDKDILSFQGVPTGVVDVSRNLIDDLTGVPMLAADGSEIKLLSSATAGAQGNFGVKLFKSLPALK